MSIWVVTGSRHVCTADEIRQVRYKLDRWLGVPIFPSPLKLYHGQCPTGGVDEVADHWGRERGIVVIPVPADWDRHKKQAGFIRNRAMLEKARHESEGAPIYCLGFPLAGLPCNGTFDCLTQAARLGIESYVFPVFR